MPNQDDEQDKNQDGEVVEVPDESEEISDDEQATNEQAETAEDSESEGELGDQEQVMSEGDSPKPKGKIKRFFAGYWRHKKWTLLLTLLVIIGILFTVPASRYPLLALRMQHSFSVEIIDSKTDTPVSGASVTLDGKTAMTDSAGKASLSAKVGKRTLNVSKKYYKSFSESIFVGIARTHNSSKVELQATGRQVPIKVVNNITGQPIIDAEVKVLDTSAKTDGSGEATIVLPTGSATQSVNITASGYNDLSGKVQITGKVVSANTFSVTPSGRVYFLSNLSGNIDVVSTNLDGTARKTVLAGTGNEDPNNTVLLASRDWKYLALLSKRDGGQYAKLYLINTSDNQVTTMDEGSATFTPVGWSGHYFVYQVLRADVQGWQSGQSALKSYNADSGKLATLDQTTAQGKQYLYVNQDFGYDDTHIVGDEILYVKEWDGGYQNQLLNGKKDQVLSINPDGSNKQDLKDFSISASMQYASVATAAPKPQQIYIQFAANNNVVEYVYENGNVTQSNALTANNFSQTNPTYLVSPSGSQTLWSEQRDGKNTLFVGDANGNNGKQIATLSDYTSYGWYTDNYLLVEKGGSELYAMPTNGGTALKISDYYKPAQNFNGYGGGYGGL
ncbi:MAG TPA: hypothetical protein VGG13_02725 [Candidatus Saccharimonadales bacterium]|jgi:hypothetical protein